MKKIQSYSVFGEEFAQIKTIEPYRGYKYKVKDIVTITVLGTICKLHNMHLIHKWATSEPTRNFLSEHFGIRLIPCYSQFTVILGNIDPGQMNEVFMSWASTMVNRTAEDLTLSLDGKTVKSTAKMKKYERPLHIASAYVSELGLVIGSQAVEGKTNEIKAVQELLTLLDIKGCVIVADALNCQKKTAEIIDRKGGTYLLRLKKNQRGFFYDVHDFMTDENSQKTMEKVTKTEKNRDRIETRTAFVSHDVDWLVDGKKWANLRCLGAIHTQVEKDGKKSEEWHFYISNKALSAEKLLKHVRLEWGIESMHWLLDVHFREDNCRVLKANTQLNLNILRKTVLNLIKRYKAENEIKQPLSGIMEDCLFDNKNLLSLVFVLVNLAFVTD